MKVIRQILKYSSYSSCFSILRSYSVRNVSLDYLSEREKICETSLNSENKSIYYFEDGLRKVYPFYHQYNACCKGRWVNKRIIDIYCNEFDNRYSREEIVRRISVGEIKVNNKVVTIDYILKNSDLISSVTHRHELAALACPIEILFEDDDLLVVNKPPSIPVHPSGMYYHNTVTSILSNEYNRHNLYPTHRLDRLASGVLLFAKSSEKSKQIHTKLYKNDVKKEYICRVEGNFPEGTVVCNKPLRKFCHKIGASIIDPEGKVAITEFKKLSFNGKSSVILCKPYTGRTHQIRVHLQYVGHPILNDPIYNSFVFGPFKGKNGLIGKTVTQLIKDFQAEQSLHWDIAKGRALKKFSNESENMFLKFSIFKEYYYMNKELPDYKKDHSKILKDKNCCFCINQDPEQISLGIFLHAYKYKTDNWKFETDIPFWASENWNIA